MSTAKRAPRFVCTKCGAPYSRWPGPRCKTCGAQSTAVLDLDTARARGVPLPFALLDTKAPRTRLRTGLDGVDKITSREGGLVPAHSALVAAVPGAGKSTLWMQVAGEIARKRPALYITSEQDTASLSALAERVGAYERGRLLPIASRSLDEIEARVRSMRPAFAVVDSASELAKHTRMRVPDVVGRLHELAHESGAAIVITSHVNAEGLVRGGPEVAHGTDAVFLLLGDPKTSRVRTLIADKNRCGDTTIAVQIKHWDHGFRDYTPPEATTAKIPRILGPGACVALVAVAGSVRVVEVQALISPSANGSRVVRAIGCNAERLRALVSVVEQAGVQLAGDVTVRVGEGLNVTDPALDAGIVAALSSAASGKAIAPGRVHSGEVGLDGRLRESAHASEAERLGVRLAGKPGERLAAAS